MRGQAFASGQGGSDGAECLGTGSGGVDNAGTFLEVVYPQRRGKPRGTRRGQHMIGAGAVIAQGFGTVTPQEDGPGMANLLNHLFGIFSGDFEMLGGNAIGDFAGFGQIADLNEGTPVAQAGADDVGTRHVGQQAGDIGLDLLKVGGMRAQKNGLGQLVVFGLGEQVHGNPFGRRGAVADDEDFAWAGNHVDADGAEDPAFGGG